MKVVGNGRSEVFTRALQELYEERLMSLGDPGSLPGVHKVMEYVNFLDLRAQKEITLGRDEEAMIGIEDALNLLKKWIGTEDKKLFEVFGRMKDMAPEQRDPESPQFRMNRQAMSTLSKSASILRSRAINLMLRAGDIEGAFCLARDTVDIYSEQKIVAFGEDITKIIAEVVLDNKNEMVGAFKFKDVDMNIAREAATDACLYATENLEKIIFSDNEGRVPEIAVNLHVSLTLLAAELARSSGNLERARKILIVAAVKLRERNFNDPAMALLEEGERQALDKDPRPDEGNGEEVINIPGVHGKVDLRDAA